MSNIQTPKGLKYVSEMLPSSLPADQNHRLFYSENGSTYRPNGMNRVIIPINCDGFIDTKQSYLRFTITNTSLDNGGNNTEAFIDGNAYNFIQRLTIYGPNSEVLEMIDNYGALMTALIDAQTGNEFRKTTGHLLMGTSYRGLGSVDNVLVHSAPINAPINVIEVVDNVYKGNAQIAPTTFGAQSTGALSLETVDILQVNDNIDQINTVSAVGYEEIKSFRLAGNGSATFELPLICGLFNNERFLPCKFINGPIRIELLLNSASNALFGTANDDVISYQLSNVGYFANVLNLQESFYENFKSVMQQRGGIQWAGTTYRRVGTELKNVAGQQTLTVTDANKSIKSIFVLLSRPNRADPDVRKSSVRTTGLCSSYYFSVGGVPIPSSPVDVAEGNGSAYAELLKAFGLLSSVDKQTSITLDNYYVEDNNDDLVEGKFMIGLDCENYTNENLESGLNTSGGQPVKLHLTTSGAPGTVLRCDVFYMVDCIFTLTPEGYLLSQH